MPPLKQALKNQYTKRIMYATGVKHPQKLARRETPHSRRPKLVANGNYMILDRYRGPEIPPQEWESLEYTTYATDPTTYFAPITSATGKIELETFSDFDKCDLDREWTPNAEQTP